ncbi:unnamed protein product [Amoebophrya sp. A120]|nr:unnamed protein product [Amoebophrya sp. A120]|eukprot:GSA120T00009482001.1
MPSLRETAASRKSKEISLAEDEPKDGKKSTVTKQTASSKNSTKSTGTPGKINAATAGDKKPTKNNAMKKKQKDKENFVSENFEGGEEDDSLPNRGRDKIERGPCAKNVKASSEFEKKKDGMKSKAEFRTLMKDALSRENHKDVRALMRTADANFGKEEKFKLCDEYLKHFNEEKVFTPSDARNVVFQDASNEWDAREEDKKAVADEADEKEKKNEKKRYFINMGIVTWRPAGKQSKIMATTPGQQLALLLTSCMEVDCEKADGKTYSLNSEKHFIASSITLNKNGTSRVHVDQGNLGHSRAMAFGEFLGGETLVYDESGDQWMNVHYGSPAAERVFSTIRTCGIDAFKSGSGGDNKNDSGQSSLLHQKKPLKLRFSDDTATEIIADHKWLKTDDGMRFNTNRPGKIVQLPFSRKTVHHTVGDFQGPLPHATAPAFPKAYKDVAKRPKELRKIDLVGTVSPDEMDFLMQWCADRQEIKEHKEFVRYVAVFYPHDSMVSNRRGDKSLEYASSWGFNRLTDKQYESARDFLEKQHHFVHTRDGLGITYIEVDGKKIATRGGNRQVQGESITKQKNRVKKWCEEQILKKYGKKQGEIEIKKITANGKDYKTAGSAKTRDTPVVFLHDLWRDWGVDKWIEKKRQEKIEQLGEENVMGKEQFWETEQKKLRNICRCYAGRYIKEWGNKMFPYKDYPSKGWCFLKGVTDISALEQCFKKHISGELTVKINGNQCVFPSAVGKPREQKVPQYTGEYQCGARLAAEIGMNEDVSDREDEMTKKINERKREETIRRQKEALKKFKKGAKNAGGGGIKDSRKNKISGASSSSSRSSSSSSSVKTIKPKKKTKTTTAVNNNSLMSNKSKVKALKEKVMKVQRVVRKAKGNSSKTEKNYIAVKKPAMKRVTVVASKKDKVPTSNKRSSAPSGLVGKVYSWFKGEKNAKDDGNCGPGGENDADHSEQEETSAATKKRKVMQTK